MDSVLVAAKQSVWSRFTARFLFNRAAYLLHLQPVSDKFLYKFYLCIDS